MFVVCGLSFVRLFQFPYEQHWYQSPDQLLYVYTWRYHDIAIHCFSPVHSGTRPMVKSQMCKMDGHFFQQMLLVYGWYGSGTPSDDSAEQNSTSKKHSIPVVKTIEDAHRPLVTYKYNLWIAIGVQIYYCFVFMISTLSHVIGTKVTKTSTKHNEDGPMTLCILMLATSHFMIILLTMCTSADRELPDFDDVTVPNDAVGDPEYVLRSLLARMEVSTYSTAFSGVDSPGTAFAQLRSGLLNSLGMSTAQWLHPVHINAVVSQFWFERNSKDISFV